MPMRPCRGDPERNAIAVAISSGAARFNKAASSSTFASRPLVWATLEEVATRSWRRTGTKLMGGPLRPQRQQGPLVLEQPTLAVEAAAVACQLPARSHHTVAGDDDGDRVLAVGRPNGAGG